MKTITYHTAVGADSDDRPLRFPAGEQHIVAGPDGETPGYVVIRGTAAEDYLSAALWIDLQHGRGHRVAAIVPYLPGARADRGTPLGCRVYADLVNLLRADRVVTLDPHSSTMPARIDNLVVVEATALLPHALAGAYTGVICPDEGARRRSRDAADALGLPCHQARKHRDFGTGALSGFSCEPLPADGRYLVVDDICDGGGTFLGLAAATGLPRERLGLWVSHGVFSAGAERLPTAYGEIHTTDSHPGHANPAVAAHVTPVLPALVTPGLLEALR